MSKCYSPEEGLELFKNASTEELQRLAQQMRWKKNPQKAVTFVLDSNPNYTNICNVACTFCAFYRTKKAQDTYTKSIEEVMKHFEFAKRAGIATVLLQGGLNDDLKLDYYIQLIKTARERYPDIFPHCFTASEIWNCARVSNVSEQDVLQSLWDAGQRTMPGGGAEVLSKRVHKKISPKKGDWGSWSRIHKMAHQIGFRTTATMMYGHIETPEDVLNHLTEIRHMQEFAHQTRGPNSGFTAFIPWSYKKFNTALERSVKNWAGKDAYFRILAFSRIYLNNFDHIQASWFGEGKEIGVEALQYGADDFGGTILEENVHRATNFINKTDHNGMLSMIRRAGFDPLQRNPLYEIVRTYEKDEWVELTPEGQIKEDDQVEILKEGPSCVTTC